MAKYSKSTCTVYVVCECAALKLGELEHYGPRNSFVLLHHLPPFFKVNTAGYKNWDMDIEYLVSVFYSLNCFFTNILKMPPAFLDVTSRVSQSDLDLPN